MQIPTAVLAVAGAAEQLKKNEQPAGWRGMDCVLLERLPEGQATAVATDGRAYLRVSWHDGGTDQPQAVALVPAREVQVVEKSAKQGGRKKWQPVQVSETSAPVVAVTIGADEQLLTNEQQRRFPDWKVLEKATYGKEFRTIRVNPRQLARLLLTLADALDLEQKRESRHGAPCVVEMLVPLTEKQPLWLKGCNEQAGLQAIAALSTIASEKRK